MTCSSKFFSDLKQQTEAHERNTPRRRWVLPFKALVMFTLLIGSWVTLVFVAQTWWLAALSAVGIGLGIAGIGFNVMHDGGHRAVSRIYALALDVLGGSSYVWHWKHNVHHHNNPNVVGLDVDIDIQPLVRLAPTQAWKPWHRYQHVYTWFLYSLLAIKWHFVDDFQNVISGRIGTHVLPRPRGVDLFVFLFGKAFFFTWAFAVPLLFHPPMYVLLGYLLASATASLSLAITFQAAHCVEEASFPEGSPDWARLQLETSVGFAQDSAAWTWLLGGLNFQTEHHLFPRVSHIHLAGLAPIVRAVCLTHGLQYRALPSFSAAIASHGRWLRQMGVRPAIS